MANKFARLFLTENGFKKIESNNHYANEYCGVVITETNYEVAKNNGDVMYSHDLNLYWLAGYLTWNGWIPNNYKKGF